MSHATTDGIDHLAQLLKTLRTGMLTTTDRDGRLRSRPMATQQLAFDGDLWFFNARSSHKTEEIAAHPQVCVSYGGAKGDWLSISGTAELVDDLAKKRELWQPIHATWFPNGVEDPDLVLLRVRVERAEYWERAHGVAKLIGGFLTSVATGRRPELADHDVIDFGR